MKELEITARTVDDAIEMALAELGVSRDQIEVDVVKKGRGGIFGMGAEEAKIKVRLLAEPRPTASAQPSPPKAAGQPAPAAAAPPTEQPRATAKPSPAPSANAQGEAVDRAREIAPEVLANILRLMDIDARVEVMPDSPETALTLNIEGQDLGALIGRRGQTLVSLQYLVRLIVSEKVKKWLPIAIDVSGYKQHRRESLQKLAQSLGEQVKSTRRSVTMEPMPADERRVVHLALAEDPDVTTQSVGEGDERKVIIQPKKR